MMSNKVVRVISSSMLGMLLMISTAFAQNSGIQPTPDVTKILQSLEANQDFAIFIDLPDSYESSNKNYPVQYILDGHHLLRGSVIDVNEEEVSTEYITVGITYSAKENEMGANRGKYLTFKPIEQIQGSGLGVEFHSFIEKELLPYVKENYRIDADNQTFIGHSLSGYFVMYSLFNAPGLFDKYIALSPSFSLRDVQKEFTDYQHPEGISSKLYVAIGEDENPESVIQPFQRLEKSIEMNKKPGLHVRNETIDGEDHFSMVQPALRDALVWLKN